jgi:biotin-[acetyl-CoA-carboxylase] ligase BirA-like protein
MTDHPAGVADHLPEVQPIRGSIPSSLVGFWGCLAPDRPASFLGIPPLLSGMPGDPAGVIHVGRASASQYVAVRNYLAGGGALSRPMICLADSGDGFTGQSGRTWCAEKGNLHLTLALPCDLPAGPEAVALTALPAVAVHRTLNALRPDPALPGPGIKWVNDILIDERKVAGVLTAVRSQARRLTSVVLGLGINVGVAPKLEASAFTPGATSLASAWPDGAPTLNTVLATVLAEVERGFLSLVHEGPGNILDAYRSGSLVIGRRVRVWPVETLDSESGAHRQPQRSGRVTRIHSDLSLELEGQETPVTSGRLTLLEGRRT